MFKFDISSVALAFVISSAPLAAAPLGLDEAAELALNNQPLLAGQQSAIKAAEQNAVAASQLPDPKLTGGLKDYPVTGSDALSFTRDNFTMLTVGVSQEFPRQEKRRLRGVREQLDAQQKAQELDLMQRTIRRDAALAWLDVFYPEQAMQLVRALQKESQIQIESLGIAYRAGKKSQADVLGENVTLDLLRDREAEYAKRAALARAALSRWIGEAADLPVSEALPELPEPPSLQRVLQQAENHPHLNNLSKQVEAAQNEVALARQAYKPDVRVDVYYGARPAFSDFIGVQVGVDLPLFTKNRQDRNLSSRLALLDKSQSLKEDASRAIKAEVRRYYAEWSSAEERTARYFDKAILPQARQRLEAAVAAYQSGRVDLASVLEARRAELDLQLQRLALQVDAAKAAVQLRWFLE
ncbi:MAG: TolC family protein [Burkholderiales bacterium]|nr:TolC family protein [Burkholderiales bacterium]MDQ3196678.1 TolC family protein [Pseudomonadota bacterium]